MDNAPPYFDFGVCQIDGYDIPFSIIELDITGKTRAFFPRTGYLIINLYNGDNFTGQYVNHEQSSGRTKRLCITGLLSNKSLEIEMNGKTQGYIIKIHPVIAYYLLKFPLCNIVNRQVELSSLPLLGSKKLKKIENDGQIDSVSNSCIKNFLSLNLPDSRIYSQDPIYHAVNKIKNLNGNVNIRNLASEFCMEHRTFNRHFLIKVGIPAQSYAKIWQLEFAIKYIQQHPFARLSEVAFQSGFYDVAHLSRVLKNQISVRPSSLRKEMPYTIENYLNTSCLD